VGGTAVIHKALYGLTSSGAAWQNMFAGTLYDLGFKSSLADPDVWKRQPIHGKHYYEYIFVYVDDLLVLSTDPQKNDCLIKIYRLKDGSIRKPKQYLGVQIKELCPIDNPSQVCWSMSSEKYVKEAIHNVKGE
jgi:hypothetical protein